MAIVKRLDPSERFQQRYGATWGRVKDFAMLYSLHRAESVNSIDVSPINFAKMLDSFASPRWISEVGMDIKIFFYALELVCHRASLPGILPEDFVPQLKRHMSTLTVADKIDNMDGVSLAFRQCFLWDIPEFLSRYPRPGTLHLATPYKPRSAPLSKPRPAPATPTAPAPKAVRKRLAKHRR